MDPLSTAAALISTVSLASRVIGKQFLEATEVLIDNYGPRVGVALAFYFGSTAPQYLRIQKSVLNGKDEGAVQFRQAVVNECNMTAIAVSTFLPNFVVTCSVSAQGAIIAQVAITGLSLPSLSSTHWLARAFLLLAVISGCLSVYYACVLQRAIGKLYRPSHIRDWLRLPPPSGDGETDVRRASLMAVLIVSAPFTMVKVSIFSFLIGLTIYQGYIWTRALDSAAGIGASRDVFITLVVGLGFCVIYFEIAFAAKDIETLMRTGRTKVEEEEEEAQRICSYTVPYLSAG